MAKVLFELCFHFRKPYNEAEELIEAFNQIIEEGGRCEITIKKISSEGNVLQLKMYRCRNSYSATSLGCKIVDYLNKEDYLRISKFNFASIYSCPVKFELIKNPKDSEHGQSLKITLHENSDSDIQNNLAQQLAVMDLAASLNN